MCKGVKPVFRLSCRKLTLLLWNLSISSVCPNLAAIWIGVNPCLFSSEAEAPASNNFLTTSKCPPSVAMCNGVESLTLLREFNTTLRSCFMSSSMTAMDPPEAAIWAQVLPSFVETETRFGLFVTKSLTTSGLFDCAAKWMGFCPWSSVESRLAPNSNNRLQTDNCPNWAAKCNGVCFCCKRASAKKTEKFH